MNNPETQTNTEPEQDLSSDFNLDQSTNSNQEGAENLENNPTEPNLPNPDKEPEYSPIQLTEGDLGLDEQGLKNYIKQKSFEDGEQKFQIHETGWKFTESPDGSIDIIHPEKGSLRASLENAPFMSSNLIDTQSPDFVENVFAQIKTYKENGGGEFVYTTYRDEQGYEVHYKFRVEADGSVSMAIFTFEPEKPEEGDVNTSEKVLPEEFSKSPELKQEQEIETTSQKSKTEALFGQFMRELMRPLASEEKTGSAPADTQHVSVKLIEINQAAAATTGISLDLKPVQTPTEATISVGQQPKQEQDKEQEPEQNTEPEQSFQTQTKQDALQPEIQTANNLPNYAVRHTATAPVKTNSTQIRRNISMRTETNTYDLDSLDSDNQPPINPNRGPALNLRLKTPLKSQEILPQPQVFSKPDSPLGSQPDFYLRRSSLEAQLAEVVNFKPAIQKQPKPSVEKSYQSTEIIKQELDSLKEVHEILKSLSQKPHQEIRSRIKTEATLPTPSETSAEQEQPNAAVKEEIKPERIMAQDPKNEQAHPASTAESQSSEQSNSYIYEQPSSRPEITLVESDARNAENARAEIESRPAFAASLQSEARILNPETGQRGSSQSVQQEETEQQGLNRGRRPRSPETFTGISLAA